MFSTLSKTNPIISATPNLSSAMALNLDIPKIVSFGKELISRHIFNIYTLSRKLGYHNGSIDQSKPLFTLILTLQKSKKVSTVDYFVKL